MHELCSGRSSPPNSIPRLKKREQEEGNWSCFEENETESMRIFSCGSCSIYIIAFGRDGMDSAKELRRLLLLLLLLLEAVDVSGPFLLPLRWGRTGMLGCWLAVLFLLWRRTIRNASRHLTFSQKYTTWQQTTWKCQCGQLFSVFSSWLLLLLLLLLVTALYPHTYILDAGCTAPTNGDDKWRN